MEQRLKVLHVVEAFCSGVFGVLRGMVNGTDDDVQAYIFHAIRPTTPKDYKSLFKPGTVFIKSKYLTREISPFMDLQAGKELRRVVQEVQPDIVHLHSAKAGAIGRLVLNGKKIPIFYSPHGYSFLMFQCSAAKRKMYYMLESICGRRPGVTVATCKGEYDSARRVTGRATYINNGIDLAELDRLGLDIEQRPAEIRVCTLGRTVAQKNPEMFNQIAEKCPNIQFIWIGGGEMENKLISPNITVTGWLPQEKAFEVMMGASVFLLPSLYEGLSLSIMEAMYLKRLCVVSRIPGDTDAIEDGKTGYLCDTLDEYVALLEKLQKEDIDEAMLQAARDRVVTDMNQTTMVRKLVELYRVERKRLSSKEE